MRKPILTIAVLAAAAGGFAAGAWNNQRAGVSAAGLAARGVRYYVDPMHPAYRSDRPGTAPDCGMALEPVYGESVRRDRPDAPPVRPDVLPAGTAKQQSNGVRVGAAAKTAATRHLRLYGRVAADETRIYTVNTGIDGFVRQASAVATGSRVRKDDWLATFAAPEARPVIQGYLVALDVLERTRAGDEGRLSTELATETVQQAADRLLTLGMAPAQIEEIARTRRVPPAIRIAAPADGFVLARKLSVGQKFLRGEEIYRIADLSRVWIVADVFPDEAEYLRHGVVAQVRVAGRAAPLRASVDRRVLSEFDSATETVKIRLDARNDGLLLRPEMLVELEVPVSLPPAIVLPTDAVVDTGTTRTVFVETSAGLFEPRRVETGWRFDGRVEIVEGLSAGERVALSGTFLLDAEARLPRAAPR